MRNKASIWCYISGVLSYIVGVILCLTLIFIPIGIYAIIFGMNYFKIAKITDGELVIVKQTLVSGAIFLSIILFPIGAVSIIPVIIAGSNNVKVSEPNSENPPPEGETVKVDETIVTETKTYNKRELSNEDKEKLEKLAKFKEQGLITQEEFDDAKRKLENQE